ncbi:hypothetical protein TUSST3_45590 [Streptomyces sp. TUS-ST3]|nr:hypothetical protein TUSST3_45590 [Streptomyces sp. TUS-ST3]
MGLGAGLGILDGAREPSVLVPEGDWAWGMADPAGSLSPPAHSPRPTPAATVTATAPAISPRVCFSGRFLCWLTSST